MWVITPTAVVIYAYLSWALFCLARIWFFPLKPDRLGFAAAALALVIRRIFFTVYAFLGLFLLDIMARCCFLGMISYGGIRYVAASVPLCTLAGMSYLLRGVFFSPTRKELIAFAGMTGVYLYLTAAVPAPALRMALFAGLGFTLFITILDICQAARRGGEAKRRQAGRKDSRGGNAEAAGERIIFAPPVWDLSRKLTLFAGAKMYVVLALLLSVELVLELEGYCLFYWI